MTHPYYIGNDCDEFIVPECFWGLDNTYIRRCDCNKVFFDVMIDFKQIRLVICKDWYVMKVKSIIARIENEIKVNYRSWERGTYVRDIKEVQSIIIKYIVEKYFKQPTLDRVIHKNKYDANFYFHNQFDLTIITCERPLMYERIDILKAIEYYVFDYRAERSADFKQNYNPEIEDLHDAAMTRLKQILEKKLTANKYQKFRCLINKLSGYNESNEINAVELLSQITIEYAKLKLKERL